MNKHKKLDEILKYLSQNIGDIPKKPDTIVKNANLNFEKSESYMMLNMLLDDGYVYEHHSSEKQTGHYGIKYKGIIFLDNGGYSIQHEIYKRKKIATKISDYVDIVVKPIGIITAVLASCWYFVKLIEFFGDISKCEF